MGILSKVATYEKKWRLVDEAHFSQDELAIIEDWVITEGNFGLNLKLIMKDEVAYIPCDTEANVNLGDKPDLTKGVVRELQKEGRENIFRFYI